MDFHLAHEGQTVVPEAVTNDKDETLLMSAGEGSVN